MSIVGSNGKPIDPIQTWQVGTIATMQSLASIMNVVSQQPISTHDYMRHKALVGMIALVDMAGRDLAFCGRLDQVLRPVYAEVNAAIARSQAEDKKKK